MAAFTFVAPITRAETQPEARAEAGAATPAANSASLSGADLLTSKEVTITAEKKKSLVVVFLSAVCPCSNSHLSELKSLKNDFPDFAFVGIHSVASEPKELTRSYFQKAELPFPVLRDNAYKIADQYKALKTPHAFVIKPDGEIVYRGGVSSSSDFARADRKFLREALDDLEHQRPVKTKEGRTLGCAITRGEKYAW